MPCFQEYVTALAAEIAAIVEQPFSISQIYCLIATSVRLDPVRVWSSNRSILMQEVLATFESRTSRGIIIRQIFALRIDHRPLMIRDNLSSLRWLIVENNLNFYCLFKTLELSVLNQESWIKNLETGISIQDPPIVFGGFAS